MEEAGDAVKAAAKSLDALAQRQAGQMTEAERDAATKMVIDRAKAGVSMDDQFKGGANAMQLIQAITEKSGKSEAQIVSEGEAAQYTPDGKRTGAQRQAVALEATLKAAQDQVAAMGDVLTAHSMSTAAVVAGFRKMAQQHVNIKSQVEAELRALHENDRLAVDKIHNLAGR